MKREKKGKKLLPRHVPAAKLHLRKYTVDILRGYIKKMLQLLLQFLQKQWKWHMRIKVITIKKK